MEVYLTNVPKVLTDDKLRDELEPYVNALGILDWHCEKPFNKTHAWVTFLNEADGKKFLQKHEKIPMVPNQLWGPPFSNARVHSRTKDKARLEILKTPIYVKKSKNDADGSIISHLKVQKHERKSVERKSVAVDNNPKARSISTNFRLIACGKNMFDEHSDALIFIEQCSLDHRGAATFLRRTLRLDLQGEGNYRLYVPYDTIQDLVADASGVSMTLVLTEAPRFYVKAPSTYFPSPKTKWMRQPALDMWPAHSKYVAHCLVYRITLSSHYVDVLESLRARKVIVITRQHLPVRRNPRPHEEDYTTCMSTFEGSIRSASASRDRLLPFVVLFQLQGLVWNNYLHPATALKMLEVMERLAKEYKRSNIPLPFTADSMKILFQKIPYPCPGTDSQDLSPEHLVASIVETEQLRREEDTNRTAPYGPPIPDSQTWVLKAVVTPTRIMLQGPDAENNNRVLRMFPHHSDYLLRVIFSDEDGQDLALFPSVDNSAIFGRYRKVLKDGIQVAGRKYEFLGFSHSSLRSHSAWFCAPFIDNMQLHNNESIINSLGDFSEIRIPAKCAARIGQAFSETPYAVDILKCGIGIKYIPDVKTADGSRVFSDGCGTISWDAIEEIWEHLPMTSTPTCLQVRLGGIKGMLSLDSRLKGKVICIRKESMMKFSSSDQTMLGICDTASKPLRFVLNRQIIKILEDMGTNAEWFIDQQNKALDVLRNVTATAVNTSTFLEYQLVGTTVGLPKLIKYLSKIGVDYRRDNFMKTVVDHTILEELRLLKHKARIPVDQGVTLFGIMDETGFLEEGEIYVTFDQQYDKVQGRVKHSLKDGLVLITRSPALHPGDIQPAQMRTPPEGHPLHDLKNCVVFSQKGTRDLPSQLSGGDLDGDLYNIFWDPRVIPKQFFTAASYPRVIPPPLDRAVTRDDIADFFVTFMETDILGMIANRHQVSADAKEEGTLHQECIKLAELHSTAVDYSKTGIPVTVQQLPKAPRMRPDFMAPAPPAHLYDRDEVDHIGDPDSDDDDEDGLGVSKPRYYKSLKILGELYRGVDEKKIWGKDVQRPIDKSGPSVWVRLHEHVRAALQDEGYAPSDIDYTRRIDEAWKLRELYEGEVVDNMYRFSDSPRAPIKEVDVFCGSILNPRGSQTRRQRDSSIKLKEEMDRVMSFYVKQMRDRGGASDTADDAASTAAEEVARSERETMNAVELCWACVIVGSEAVHGRGYMGDQKPLESFRVVAASCLVKELNELLTRKRLGRVGGFVGVRSGPRFHGALPLR
ncbi:RdRP-domain-containing protein [Trichoderma reesei RUT C-30]|uniref:RNA-dependent RNA polymerase n=2 Tax=Hypocrea jecorina TaxID=51453 RepID=A0A024SAZ6_HYPJR|nr:RdRP-domain-containing protein [Trichoderma reesei RUT C-30]